MNNRIISDLLNGLPEIMYEESMKDEQYVQLSKDISELLSRCENVRNIVEYNHVIALTEDDCEVLIKWIELEGTRLGMELEVAYVQVHKDCFEYIKAIGVVKENS